jgi:SAM-dependent methyltransferase
MTNSTVTIIASGPSLDPDDWPKIKAIGDTLVINYAYIPLIKAWGKAFSPTFAFTADDPLKCLPHEWVFGDQVCVLNKGNAAKYRDIISNSRPNWDLFTAKGNTDWQCNPFKLHGDLLSPYKSLLLAIQYCYRMGYDRINLYGVDLQDSTTYAGIEDACISDQQAKGKALSHDAIIYCLKHYARHAAAAGVELVSLNFASPLVSFMETMTVHIYKPTDIIHESTDFDAKQVYEDLYANHGYHEDPNYSHSKPLARWCVNRLDFNSVLDVGCSAGWAINFFAQQGKDAKGIDVSASAIQHCREQGYKAYQKSVTEIADNYDLIFSTDTMEHLHPDEVDAAIEAQHTCARKYIAVKICPRKDRASYKDKVGHPLHQTIRPIPWWINKYEAHPSWKLKWRQQDMLVFEKGNANG